MYLHSQTTHLNSSSFAVVASVVCVFAFAFTPGLAAAYFSDADNQAADGSFATGLVNATLSTNDPNQDLMADTVTSFSLTTDDGSTLTTQSRLSFAPQSCRADLYNEILLEVTTASGTTASTFADAEITETGVPGTYTLDVIASADLVAVANESCVIEATLETWQTEFAEPSVGFSSATTTAITLTTTDPIGPQVTTTVVLNELYPAVLSTTTEPLEREWVELYNGTGAAVDVAGWRIDEYISGDTNNASRSHTIVASCSGVTLSDHMQPFNTNDTVIPAGGFLVVEFCGSASYLSDGGDTVELYNVSASQVDIHAFPPTANGKSHARIPDGAAWVDPAPTPGNKNTATRADLEAEGWDEATIDSTLALLEADTESQATSTNSQSSSTAANSLPATQTTATTSNFSFSTGAPHASSALSTTASTTAATGTSTATSTSTKTASSSATSTTTDRASSTTTTTASSSVSTTTVAASTTVASSSDTEVPLSDDSKESNLATTTPPATTTKPALPADETNSNEAVFGDEPPVKDGIDADTTAESETDTSATITNTSDSQTTAVEPPVAVDFEETDKDVTTETDTETAADAVTEKPESKPEPVPAEPEETVTPSALPATDTSTTNEVTN